MKTFSETAFTNLKQKTPINTMFSKAKTRENVNAFLYFKLIFFAFSSAESTFSETRLTRIVLYSATTA